MAKQAVLVRYTVKLGAMDEFLAFLRRHIANTKDREPGCVQFDILIPHQGKDLVYLYEVYADEDALRLHNSSDHLIKYKAQTDALLSGRKITWCAVEE